MSRIWIIFTSKGKTKNYIYVWHHDLDNQFGLSQKMALEMKSIQNSVAPPVEDWLVHQNDKRSGGAAISAVRGGRFQQKSIEHYDALPA